MAHWRKYLNVQNVEKGFSASFNSYGIPDIKRDEFEVKTLILYRADSNRNGTDHFFLDDCRFERCWKNPGSQIAELKKYEGVLSPDFLNISFVNFIAFKKLNYTIPAFQLYTAEASSPYFNIFYTV